MPVLAPSWRGANALHVARKLGLTAGLKLVLDAGDAASYPGSGQSWLDLSGSGYDFFRGASSSATTDDPAFNGTAGRMSSGEYWSFDGGDFFRYDSANETWMSNLHKDNAKFTFAGWFHIAAAAAARGLCGTGAGNASNTGMAIFIDASNNLNFAVRNGSGTNALTATLGTSLDDQWAFYACSVDEAVGSNGLIGLVNNSVTTGTSTYSSPTASNTSFTMEIGSRGNAQSPLSNGSRLAMACFWESVALTERQLAAFFNATRGRFGV